MLSLYALLEAIQEYGCSSPYHPGDVAISAVTADSRAVAPGALFVAVQGGQVDGHRFIANAIERGAAAVLGTLWPAQLREQGIVLPDDMAYVWVDDSRQALAICAAALYNFPSASMTIIGITGTDGKTTTASLLEAILATATRTESDAAGRVGLITTVGARIRGGASDTGLHVTTPDAPAVQRFLAIMRDAGCQYAIVESTSHGLDQARVAAVHFDVAAVTNITHEHLDYHGTRDAYVAAKAKLFQALYALPTKPGVPRYAILNADDAGSFAALQAVLSEASTQSANVVAMRTYGLLDRIPDFKPDVTAATIAYLPNRTSFRLDWWGGEFSMETRLIGEFNVYNVLCAATVALALGIKPEMIQAGVANFGGVLGRMERIDHGQPFLAIVDFAHTPVSLERALLTLRPLVGQGYPQGRLIAVFGSAGLRDKAKRSLMGKVSGQLADFTVITAEDPRTEDLTAINASIAAGVNEFVDEHKYVIVPDRRQAIQFAVNMAGPGDVVAAFGKGHERSMCFGETEHPWSDQGAMHEALAQRIAITI